MFVLCGFRWCKASQIISQPRHDCGKQASHSHCPIGGFNARLVCVNEVELRIVYSYNSDCLFVLP